MFLSRRKYEAASTSSGRIFKAPSEAWKGSHNLRRLIDLRFSLDESTKRHRLVWGESPCGTERSPKCLAQPAEANRFVFLSRRKYEAAALNGSGRISTVPKMRPDMADTPEKNRKKQAVAGHRFRDSGDYDYASPYEGTELKTRSVQPEPTYDNPDTMVSRVHRTGPHGVWGSYLWLITSTSSHFVQITRSEHPSIHSPRALIPGGWRPLSRLHIRFLTRFLLRLTLHLFREASPVLERKLSRVIWIHSSFQFLLTWRYFVPALRD